MAGNDKGLIQDSTGLDMAAALVGPIFPRSASNIGLAAGGVLGVPYVGLPVGSVFSCQFGQVFVGNGDLWNLSYTTFGNAGSAVWGLRGVSNDIVRLDFGGILDVVPLNDIGYNVSTVNTVSSLVLDNGGNAWTLVTTNDGTVSVLVNIQQEPPKIVARYLVPGDPKSILTYDPVNNAIVLSNVGGSNVSVKTSRFSLATKTFSADVRYGILQGPQMVFYAGGSVYMGGSDIGNGSWLRKLDPVSLSVTGTINGLAGVPNLGYAYAANGGTPKLFITTTAQDTERVDVGTFTIEKTLTMIGSSGVYGLAFNPTDNSLWVTDVNLGNATFWRIADALGAFVTYGSHTLDASNDANSGSITWTDVGHGQMLVASPSIDRIYFVNATTFAVASAIDLVGQLQAIGPGNEGQRLTAHGPNRSLTWA
jgi:hypothetical protein